MKANCKQLTFNDFFENFDDFVNTKKPMFLELFENYIDIKSFIPHEFYESYYSSTGRPRDYSLQAMILALIFKCFFSLPKISILILFLSISSELRSACGFTSVPHKSQFSRFMTDFYHEINLMFHRLVDITQPICEEIDPFKSSILISDTTGFEGYVKENNPKFFNSILKASKTLAKVLKSKGQGEDFNIHNHAYSKMPKTSSANDDIKLCYLNGHFGYYLKANIVTDDLGIVRHIDFYEPDEDCNVDSPDSLKDKYDSKTLIPVLENFSSLHPSFSYKYFLGDSGFDACDNYEYLCKDKGIIPIISINPRNQSDLPETGFNELGVPTCPNDHSLTMKFDGVTREKGRADRLKWLCPKSNILLAGITQLISLIILYRTNNTNHPRAIKSIVTQL
ncbi:transposase [Paramaledivibacter caminithermalis]|jgi:hypothetical protein|uniref:Transposase InsH N-terminal domain-containing protein n=1 Tax=Paramaledivibacter caminithermalis (strain DSM 15212 / CIP 107654 / DViRD3) TaxID=1121301 RepID=A0A1M6LMH8_PARC5|nr:transposase [Paramaledivibacter caminithermalis]SHJ72407.1 hypothetical protein SAMN02745912_00847 [Paramaledivibacter caminithermalis DSM 15212]